MICKFANSQFLSDRKPWFSSSHSDVGNSTQFFGCWVALKSGLFKHFYNRELIALIERVDVIYMFILFREVVIIADLEEPKTSIAEQYDRNNENKIYTWTMHIHGSLPRNMYKI